MRPIFCLVLFLSFLILTASNRQQAQIQTGEQFHRRPISESPDGEALVIKVTEDGMVCRGMTEVEYRDLRIDEFHSEVKEIGEQREVRLMGQQGLKIILRGTTQLEQFPQAKDAFLRAAAKWESVIQSPITVVFDVDFGPTRFGVTYPSGVLGSTSPQQLFGTNFYGTVRTSLISQASDAQQQAIFNALPVFELPTDQGATRNLSSASSVLRAIGQINPVADPDAERSSYGSPPSIGFNSNFSFDFDPSDGIDTDKFDFEGIAVHEIGHALGFISSVGSRELSPTSPVSTTIWDLFRFRPGNQAPDSITGSQRVLLTGGDHVYFVGESEIGLSTASGAGTGGDGRQASHWKDDVATGQYLGIMDPTGGNGQRLMISPADLTSLNYFGFKINPNFVISELQSLDDNSNEIAQSFPNGIAVNRFTPSRYPSTLQSVRVHIPSPADGSTVVGQTFRLIAFIDQNRTGKPPANPSLIVDRTVTIPTLPNDRMVEFIVPNPPVIGAGDVYVGIQATSPSVWIAGDRSGRQQGRSFISTNNGASFQPLVNESNLPLNFMLRVVMTSTYGVTATPAPASISPDAAAPGSQSLTLVVQGGNFKQNSVVRWNHSDRVTTFVNGAQLQAQIQSADLAGAGSAQVTVFTPGAGESGALTFTVGNDRPVPSITRLTPSVAAVGSQTPIPVNLFGLNFTPQSVIRVNGSDRQTNLVSGIQLSTTLQPAELASSGVFAITVFNPGPGGGTSNEMTLAATVCSYSLSTLSQTSSSSGGNNGIVLNTNSACPWAINSNAPWINITNPVSANGSGKYVINYRIDPNLEAVRNGVISVGGQNLNIRQVGRVTAISAASYGSQLAPDSIASGFGIEMAKGTQSASSQPLPNNLNGTSVTMIDAAGAARSSPLFFVSPNQVNFLIPSGSVSGVATVRVFVDSQQVADGPVSIANVAPSLFTADASGRGLASALIIRVKADGSQAFEPVVRFDSALSKFVAIPIDFGAESDRIFLVLFGSGIRGRSSLGAVSLKLGEMDIPAVFAGAQTDFVGLDQVNCELQRSLKGRGEVTLILSVAAQNSNPVIVSFK